MCRIHPMELEGSATRVGNTSLNEIGRRNVEPSMARIVQISFGGFCDLSSSYFLMRNTR